MAVLIWDDAGRLLLMQESTFPGLTSAIGAAYGVYGEGLMATRRKNITTIAMLAGAALVVILVTGLAQSTTEVVREDPATSAVPASTWPNDPEELLESLLTMNESITPEEIAELLEESRNSPEPLVPASGSSREVRRYPWAEMALAGLIVLGFAALGIAITVIRPPGTATDPQGIVSPAQSRPQHSDVPERVGRSRIQR